MNNLAPFFLIIMLISWVGCKDNNEKKYTQDERIFNKILVPILDSLDIKEHEIYIDNHESDEVKQLIIKGLKSSMKNDTTQQAKMVRKLANSLKDEINLELEINSEYYQLCDTETNENFNTVKVNLSRIIFSNKKDIGCFFMSIDKQSYRAFIIFIKKSEVKMSDWKVIGIIPFIH